VDAGEQAADAVAGAGRFTGEVVVEPGQNTEFGEGLVTDIDAAQRVWHGAGGISDDVGVAGIGLGLTWVKVGDATHRQPGQIGDIVAAGAGDGHRQGADRVGLIDHDRQPAVSGELVEHRPQPRLVIGQCLVEQPFPVRVEPGRRACRRPCRGRSARTQPR
jgi:hypothetical protein